jgi:hypothetical protein
MSKDLREFLCYVTLVITAILTLTFVGACVEDAYNRRSCLILGENVGNAVKYVRFDKCYVKVGDTWVPRDMLKATVSPRMSVSLDGLGV